MGAGLAEPLAMKPHVTDWPAARLVFQPTGRAVTSAPFWTTVAFQDWVIRCPPVSMKRTVQPLRGAALVLRTLTSPWKAPCH